jgi:hypothetical protein
LRFVNDDINRVYAILNIKEMNFADNTWNATLIEIFNEVNDVDVSATFIANFVQNTYINIPTNFKLPLTLESAGGFDIINTDTIKYLGATSIETPIDCIVFGIIKVTNPQQTTIVLTLRKNGVAIKTGSFPVYIPNQSFIFNLSTEPIAINTNDEFTITTSSNIRDIEIDGGSVKINTPTITQSFDSYQDKFIYK